MYIYFTIFILVSNFINENSISFLKKKHQLIYFASIFPIVHKNMLVFREYWFINKKTLFYDEFYQMVLMKS